MDQVFGALGIVAVIIGAVLMARRDLKTFPVGLVGHGLWFTNGWLTSNWALVILNVILVMLTCYTWWVFSKYKQWK